MRPQAHVYSVTTLLNNISHDGPCVAAEIGVYRGQTSAHLLRSLPKLILYMVDPWCVFEPSSTYAKTGDILASETPEQVEANYQESLKVTEFASDRRIIVRKLSTEAAIDIVIPLDLVFIDAEHSFEAVTQDIGLWWPKVRGGGVLCGHDYTYRFRSVVRAVNAWSKAASIDIKHMPGTVWWCIK